MFVGESGISRVIQRTAQKINELQTDDVGKLRAAGVIDLPTLQRYINFYFSVTIDLFGAGESSNAATFYSLRLKGRFEEGRRLDDHVLKGQPYTVIEAKDGQLIEKEVPMPNALNEVLRDDYIKESVAGVERPGYKNLSLTHKRVLVDHQDRPVRGAASNYLCDLQVGDAVQVIGPFGTSFLMPNHPLWNIVMICTGNAPMRAMTEWRRRRRKSGKFEGGKFMLFFGARTQEELPYFGLLQSLPKDFIDINFAFSRKSAAPKRCTQAVTRERSADLALLPQKPGTYLYMYGLKSMEECVVLALHEVAPQAKPNWDAVVATLKSEGRLHLETY